MNVYVRQLNSYVQIVFLVAGDCVAVPLSRANLSEQLLASITALATTRDPSECKQLPLLFNFFLTYLSLGLNEKFQLIKVFFRVLALMYV